MSVPPQYANNFVSIKYMLSSYRALVDGRAGIRHLESLLSGEHFLFSEWKIVWTGVCTTLRSSIDLFRIDSRSCLSHEIREQLKVEWNSIKTDQSSHPIYWDFLKHERDNIVHEYKWSAYEAWLEPDGTVQAPPSLLGRLLADKSVKPVLLMRHGPFHGQDSLRLLAEAADWVEQRIFAAIQRAGFDPDEQRGVSDFKEMPKQSISYLGLLGSYVDADG